MRNAAKLTSEFELTLNIITFVKFPQITTFNLCQHQLDRSYFPKFVQQQTKPFDGRLAASPFLVAMTNDHLVVSHAASPSSKPFVATVLTSGQTGLETSSQFSEVSEV